jgi:hypothetical protein
MFPVTAELSRHDTKHSKPDWTVPPKSIVLIKARRTRDSQLGLVSGGRNRWRASD